VRREWRNDPGRLPSCRFPASLWPIVVAVSATANRHLAASDRIESLTRTFDGTERDSHIDSLERAYARLCEVSCPRVFPMSARPRPKPSSFSEPTTHPVRGRAAYFELASAFLRSALRLAPEHQHDAYDRLLLPTT